LRLIQLYNAGEFHCDAETEDGYALGPGAQDCASHSADYAPQDWRLNLSELLRSIQFYNAIGYLPCNEGEDGFCPVFGKFSNTIDASPQAAYGKRADLRGTIYPGVAM